MKRNCKFCGEEFFLVKPSSKKTFCDLSCFGSYNVPKGTVVRKPKSKTTKSCEYCDKRTTNPTYCSEDCSNNGLKKKVVENFLSGNATSITGKAIYEYLLEAQGNTCSLCPTQNTWFGNPLVFVRDHIDGNSENNHPTNIRLICSNCDSQLPTFKSRNRGNGRHYRRVRYAEGKSY